MRAQVVDPEGAVLFEATRRSEARAVLSCKVANCRTKRVGEDTFQEVRVFPAGSVIRVASVADADGNLIKPSTIATWDGARWV